MCDSYANVTGDRNSNVDDIPACKLVSSSIASVSHLYVLGSEPKIAWVSTGMLPLIFLL